MALLELNVQPPTPWAAAGPDALLRVGLNLDLSMDSLSDLAHCSWSVS